MDASTLWLAACLLLFTAYKYISFKYKGLISNSIYRVGFVPIIALPSLILDDLVTGSFVNYIAVGVLFIYMLVNTTKILSRK